MEHSSDQSLLEQYFADRDEPCPGCGYNLRALKGPHCPECGDMVRLCVGLENPTRGPFITGLVGLACAAGFSGLALPFVLKYGLDPTQTAILVCLLVELVASICLILIWLKHAHRLRRRNRWLQFGSAAICWLWPTIVVIVAWYIINDA